MVSSLAVSKATHTPNRWSRRDRAAAICERAVAKHDSSSQVASVVGRTCQREEGPEQQIKQVGFDSALIETVSPHVTECDQERLCEDESRASSLPENLQALLDSDLVLIKTSKGCLCAPADGVVDVGAAMAQQGLFPRSKMGSAQLLISECGLSSSFNKVLQGGARHLRGVFGHSDDLGLFEALRYELGRGEGAWSRGTKGAARIKWSIPGLNGCGLLDGEIVQDLFGNELPAFSFVLRSLSETIEADMLSWWVNIYEEGNIGLGFHHDHQSNNNGLRWGRTFDVTAGASFGACRELTFRHALSGREFGFPQANGDIFAFDTHTDLEFMHGIYHEKQRCGPRVSVIMVGKSKKTAES